jgi:hypothetical protein
VSTCCGEERGDDGETGARTERARTLHAYRNKVASRRCRAVSANSGVHRYSTKRLISSLRDPSLCGKAFRVLPLWTPSSSAARGAKRLYKSGSAHRAPYSTCPDVHKSLRPENQCGGGQQTRGPSRGPVVEVGGDGGTCHARRRGTSTTLVDVLA